MAYIKINKPLHGTFCNIRAKILRDAIKAGESLTVEIPDGKATVCPRWWMKTGKRVEQVFRYPDSPMIMYGNYVPINKETEEEKIKKLAQLGIFG